MKYQIEIFNHSNRTWDLWKTEKLELWNAEIQLKSLNTCNCNDSFRIKEGI